MDPTNVPSSTLPPGFRFHPTDQELIIHYLKKKVISSSPNPLLYLQVQSMGTSWCALPPYLP